MSYDPGAIEAALAAAVGDEPALIAELRAAFQFSLQRALRDMEVANDVGDWRLAAFRLKGLAASFGAVKLMSIADDASTVPHDSKSLDRIRRAIDRI